MKTSNFFLCSILFVFLGILNDVKELIGTKSIFVIVSFSVILIIRLRYQSKLSSSYSYGNGFIDSIFIGGFGVFLFSIFSIFSKIIYEFSDVEKWTDIISKFLTAVPEGSITMFFGIIKIFILSIILPLFFIKNKKLDNDLILDDDKY